MNLAEVLNLHCLCRTLHPQRLQQQLEADPALQGLAAELAASHPHLFSQTAVFCAPEMSRAIEDAVATIERVIALPAWHAHAASHLPAIATHAFGPRGVFMGYDFHMSEQGPRLIEINTNAGGAFLNAAAARAHRDCCESMHGLFDAAIDVRALDTVFFDMFMAEWKTQRGDAPLRTVLIVDDAPQDQYPAPEFALARQLLLRRGIVAVVADARELRWDKGALWHPALPDGLPVDLVYNRLTDFDLSQTDHTAMRNAYVAGAAVITPHPRVHALYADKRNLIALSDDALLIQLGVSDTDRALLRQVVPCTRLVTPANADDLWAGRRQLFFKPVAGYGGKAAYRGDKLTRRAWGDICAGDFVAQELVPPSERMVNVDGTPTLLKLDVRAYAYAGTVQLLAARTWAGQTTNFRTRGGGFSPVVVLPSLSGTESTAIACGTGRAGTD